MVDIELTNSVTNGRPTTSTSPVETSVHRAGVELVSEVRGKRSPGVVPHPDTHVWCALLERIWLGRAAASLLASGDLTDHCGAVFVAPMWSWVIPEIPVGRKSTGPDGKRRLLPVRVEWLPSPLVIVEAGASVRSSYQARGLGVEWAGSMVLQPTGAGIVCGSVAGRIEDPSSFPEYGEAPVCDPDTIRSLLDAMVTDGALAQWESLAFIEPMLSSQLKSAHSSLSMDILDGRGDLLSEQTMETLNNLILLGDSGDHDSFALSTIKQSVSVPDLFVKVDPLHWLRTVVRREAQQAVQSRIGDPHIGPRVRRVARELNTKNAAEVMVAYRSLHRSDLPSEPRTRAALNVSPDPMAHPLQVESVPQLGGWR